MITENIIKITARHSYTLFPKAPNILGTGDSTYGIVTWNVVSVIEGDPKVDAYDNITITGTYEEEIDRAKSYTILAKEKTHEKYGLQHELMFIGEILNLENVGNQKSFLKTFLTDGQIEEMFKVLDNPLKTIQTHDVASLKKVHGIGDYISNCIIERFEECKDNCGVYIELDGLGLTPKFIQKLISQYKNPNLVIEIVKKDPYRLSYDVDGIGFKTADNIALNAGVDPKSPERIKAYIVYLLTELGEGGNSYITSGELTSYIFDEFGGKDEILDVYLDDCGNVVGNNIGVATEELQKKNILVIEDTDPKSQRRVYLKKYWELEISIANHLKRIAFSHNKFSYDNWESIVEAQEMRQGWKFTEEQKNGIKLGLDKQLCFITGGAGSGKSSLVSGILECLKKYSFAQTALAGKASARLQEVTGKEGHTIHRLLGYNPALGFLHNEENPLSYDIIILDELSLVGGNIFLDLIRAIPSGTKLIMLGDMGQLESIGCMNLAHDIYHSEFVDTVELKQIHRQAEKSGIIIAARKVREGEALCKRTYVGRETTGELQDMHYDILSGNTETRSTALKYYKDYYTSETTNNIMDIQILAPVKGRGDASVFNLNLDIQEFVNPTKPFAKELKIEYSKDDCFYLREGDKVMCIKNNYKLFNTQGRATEVFNGWTGILESIDVYEGVAIIYFPIIKDRVVFPVGELKRSVILGYASTVHKYQGSSAKIIIGVLDYSIPPYMRTKELVYTMITRAEKECVLVAQNKALDDSIQISGITDKNTFLTELLDTNESVTI